MKAVAKIAPEPEAVALIDRPMPSRRWDEAIIRITAAGICGTDVSIWLWRPAIAAAYAPDLPNIIGHEFCGVVEEAEASSGFRTGDRVVVNPQLACGQCRYCRGGQQTLCDHRLLMGGHVDGGWTEYVSVPARNLLKVPDGLNERVLPLIEPLTVGVHSVFQRVIPHPDDVVVVIGPGPVGLIHALLLKVAGISTVFVAGLARDAARLQTARELGAIPVIVDQVSLMDTVLARAPQGADIVYACSGATTELATASRVVRKGGRIAALGLPGEPSWLEVTPIVMRQVEIVGTRGYNDSTWNRMMELVEPITSDALKLISHELPMSSYQTAFDLVERREATKVILLPNFT